MNKTTTQYSSWSYIAPFYGIKFCKGRANILFLSDFKEELITNHFKNVKCLIGKQKRTSKTDRFCIILFTLNKLKAKQCYNRPR